MPKHKFPVTAAVRALRAAKISFVPHLYQYVEHGGTQRSASELGLDEHIIIKTIVLETEKKSPLIVLMHGDQRVSGKAMARTLGVKSVQACDPVVATRHTGYLVGGTSPFGLRNPLPTYLERSIAALDRLLVNGGKRGFLVELRPRDLISALSPTLVDARA